MHAQFEALYAGRSLSRRESRDVFEQVMRGECSPIAIAALLVALKAKGEHSDEVAGAAAALRAHARPFPRPDYLFADTCGTGGDGAGTLNISTAVALVLAECGIPVAKHGNRAVSSRSGSADVLEALGLKLDPEPQVARRMLDETGFCFLFAPQYHPATAHAMPVRRELATRTLFNLVGPLVHPGAPPLQLVGVYDARLCRTVAETLRTLGCTTALVVNGGVDEVALHGPTHAALLRDGTIEELTIQPADAGLRPRALAELAGGGAAENAQALTALLSGCSRGAYAEAVALNAGAVLWVARRVQTLADGVVAARDAIASGRCQSRLDRAVAISHGR